MLELLAPVDPDVADPDVAEPVEPDAGELGWMLPFTST
jgi:hypothetical protein